MSIFPFSSHLVTMILNPAIDALAGLVPCADEGINTILRWPSPLSFKYSRITIKPVYSPCAPALGCKLIASKPVISHNAFSSSEKICM